MSRKLRFFKDQINKAGLISSTRIVLQRDIDLEDLEVSFYFWVSPSDMIIVLGFAFKLLFSCFQQLYETVT